MATAPDVDHDLRVDRVDEIYLIPTAEIDRGERMRSIDEVWAGALGQIMLREQQQVAIEVCRLPGSQRWLVVAGAHRHRGAELVGIEALRAIVVSANRDDRRMREVSENLWRRDLDPIDRAAFVAEAVAIHKRRAGIDPEADGRAASVAARWQKAIAAEASDTNDTMAVAYGWSAEVAAQLNLGKRSIERDLMLYRRLAPSLIAKLRRHSHPVATNATQLRALAKLEARDQQAVVDMLTEPGRSLGYPVPRSVAEAIGHPYGPRPAKPVDASGKRLSTFIATYQRMSLAERKGALAQLAGQLPAEFVLADRSVVAPPDGAALSKGAVTAIIAGLSAGQFSHGLAEPASDSPARASWVANTGYIERGLRAVTDARRPA